MHIIEHYEPFVRKHTSMQKNTTENLLHASIGISGESGEVLDEVKKLWVYSKLLDTAKLRDELGDVFFYFMMMVNHLKDINNITLEDIILHNMEKLKKRYPNGFSKESANARFTNSSDKGSLQDR